MTDPWQEFECPQCKIDFDIEPPLALGTEVECVHCKHIFAVADDNHQTMDYSEDGVIVVPTPGGK